MRGYFGIVLYEPKYITNAGSIIRSAACFGAAFVCTVGHRYHKDAMDTMNGLLHFPGFHFATLADCLDALPMNCMSVRVEMDGRYELGKFTHPERAAYFFGGEDRTVPPIRGSTSVIIPTRRCLNVAVSASIVMYDRVNRA